MNGRFIRAGIDACETGGILILGGGNLLREYLDEFVRGWRQDSGLW
jgi:hypothetical protein